jgi:hypothetical protein
VEIRAGAWPQTGERWLDQELSMYLDLAKDWKTVSLARFERARVGSNIGVSSKDI